MNFMTLEFGAREAANEERKRLAIASAFALLLHLAALLCLLRPSTSLSEERIEVRLLPDEIVQTATIPPPPQPKTQIVSPSQTPPEPPKVDTPLRSEHDTRAEKESIKRGEGEKASPRQQPVTAKQMPQKQSAPEKAAEDLPKVSKLGSANLRLSESELVENALKQSPKQVRKNDAPTDSARAAKFVQEQPFQHSLSASVFNGISGSTDYLPNIPDGDITLLNAKADRFAVFVRRVSLQVFGALRQMNWQELSHAELKRLQNFSTLEAVMDKSGKLIRVRMEDSSGSSVFDQVSKRAAEKGAWDQNPPAESVAADGNIHFVFKTRSWSRVSPNGRGEQRWLLLGTGLL